MSPSLRGSGLKFVLWDQKKSNPPVSLFTREWIEISRVYLVKIPSKVSLFTREWIEISTPSGGLIGAISLPLYEGVD